jgi:hypothetical protein
MMIIGYVQARTQFPNTGYSTYSGSDFTGPGGPLLAVSPIYNLHASKWLKCIVETGRSAVEIIGGIVAWAKANVANPAIIKLVTGAAEGGAVAVTLGEFFSVCILAFSPLDWALAAGAVGLAAYTIFEAVRCAQEAMDG